MVKEKFLLDTNTFITPYKSYYPFDLAPSFWKQLLPKLSSGNVSVLDIVQAEILKGDDELSEYIKSVPNINICSIKNSQIIIKYAEVLNYIQSSGLYTERALREWSRPDVADPWLIATARTYDYTLITFETSAGKITTASNKPKIPDIGAKFGIKIENLFYFMREMGFSL